jgi:hypothetical protein
LGAFDIHSVAPKFPVKRTQNIISSLQKPVCLNLKFLIKNKDLYTTDQEIHSINIKSNINLHPQVCNLTVFQKGAYCSGIMLFNHLPLKLKRLSNEIKLFKPAS